AFHSVSDSLLEHESNNVLCLASCVLPLVKQYKQVQESQPVVHRLHLSVSASVPTNPGRTSLPQETLVIRWTGFSPVFRYSYRHSHFYALHLSSRSDFAAHRTLSYHKKINFYPCLRYLV